MAITKANILTEVKQRTSRTDLTCAAGAIDNTTDITRKIESTLYDICTRAPFLVQDAAVTVTAGAHSANLPTDFSDMVDVWVASGSGSSSKLKMVTFREYVSFRNINSTASTPLRCAVSRDSTSSYSRASIFIHPPPSAETVLTIYYSYQDDDIDNIELPNRFREAIIEGTCYRVWLGMDDTEKSTFHKEKYDEQLQILLGRYGFLK